MSSCPFFIGKPGCVRSKATSKLNTAALCGGSGDYIAQLLLIAELEGADQVRLQAMGAPHPVNLWVVFRCRAIDRHDQWVASFGVVCVVASITSLRNCACFLVFLPP